MIEIDVCLEAVFTNLPTEKRIEKIARAGYRCVEFWFHDATFDGKECSRKQPKNAASLAAACKKHGITINNMVVNAPDGSFGGAPVKAADRNQYLGTARRGDRVCFGRRLPQGHHLLGQPAARPYPRPDAGQPGEGPGRGGRHRPKEAASHCCWSR